VLRVFTVVVLTAGSATTLMAQQPEPTTRDGEIEKAQAEKVPTLHPYVISTGERLVAKAETILTGSAVRWHPFLENAGPGGGFPFGVGYAKYVSPYNLIDVRGSYTIKDYKRAEAEFTAPRLFQRRGELSVLAGWREATQVGFFGLGTNSALDDRTNYLFQQSYASGLLTVRPTRRFLTLSGGAEWTRWKQRSGEGSYPSVETKYTPETLPGLGAEITYLHTQGTIGFDWRTSAGYARRGGFYGVTVHDYNDRDSAFGHDRIDYEVVQHVPILREAWVLSLHGLASAASNKDGQQIPFFMTPSLGGGHNLRGYDSFRFRDRNSLLLQGEWRIMVNRFFDFAFFYDAGKVTPHRSELDFSNLKSDYGLGARFHGLFSTPFRVELARSNERLAVVFASTAAF
jgi:Omp85 superfamily domain